MNPDVSASRRNRRLHWFPWIALAVAAVLLRAAGLHDGLIYPDGYDYLLMARGIASHLQPTLHLGAGGVLFSPPLDAAVKPFFPAVTAILSIVFPLRTAANVVTVIGGAGTVVLAGLVCLRITGSQTAGLLAGACALTSPALAFWSGFTGPDALAPALALGAALLMLDRRPVAGGIVAALCVATRPEWLLAGLVVAAVAATRRDRRAGVANALIAGAFTLALIYAVLRPPLGTHLGLHAGTGAHAILGSGAVRALVEHEWPLIVVALIGLLVAVRRGLRSEAATLAGVLAVLTAVYLVKNPGSERYLSQLVPLACVCAGMAVMALSWRSAAVAAAVTLTAQMSLTVAEPAVGVEPFTAVAARLRALSARTIVTAAPEAYGYLLPARRVELMRPGARGLVVLDGAQRTYAPRLNARGEIVARINQLNGFARPDGTIDRAPVLVVRGTVVRTG